MKTNALLFINNAQMAKLADASDLNSDDYYNRAGSIPALSTFINLKMIIMRAKKSIRAWVAREKNGALFLFWEKPKKCKSYWTNLNTFNSLVLPEEAFPNVKWEDNEPIRVYIRIAQYDNQKKLFKQYTHKYQ